MTNIESVKLLLEHGADPNLVGERDKISALEGSLYSDGFELINLLIAHGATIKDDMIYSTVGPRNPAGEIMTKWLLDQGVDANHPPSDGALHYIALFDTARRILCASYSMRVAILLPYHADRTSLTLQRRSWPR